jgi:hypothetical protein
MNDYQPEEAIPTDAQSPLPIEVNTATAKVRLPSLEHLIELGDPIQEWSWDIVVDGKPHYHAVSIQRQPGQLAIEVVVTNTLPPSLEGKLVTVRFYDETPKIVSEATYKIGRLVDVLFPKLNSDRQGKVVYQTLVYDAEFNVVNKE